MREQVSVQAVHALNGYCSRRLRCSKLLLTPLQGVGVVLFALYVIYQVVGSATGGGWREIVYDVVEHAVGLLLGYISVATYPHWKPYVPVELPL